MNQKMKDYNAKIVGENIRTYRRAKNLSQKEANILIEIDKVLKNELNKPPEYIDEMCGKPINPPILMLSPPNYELELKRESSTCRRCLICSSKEVRQFLICSSSSKPSKAKTTSH